MSLCRYQPARLSICYPSLHGLGIYIYIYHIYMSSLSAMFFKTPDSFFVEGNPTTFCQPWPTFSHSFLPLRLLRSPFAATMIKQFFALLALFASASAFVPSSSAGMLSLLTGLIEKRAFHQHHQGLLRCASVEPVPRLTSPCSMAARDATQVSKLLLLLREERPSPWASRR